jgi:hypothetical protein
MLVKTMAAWKAYYSAQGGDPPRVEMIERTYDGLRDARRLSMAGHPRLRGTMQASTRSRNKPMRQGRSCAPLALAQCQAVRLGKDAGFPISGPVGYWVAADLADPISSPNATRFLAIKTAR